MWNKPILIYLLTGFVMTGLLLWHFLIGPSDDFPGSFFNRNENAMWLRHSWVDTDQSWESIADMVHGLEKHGIKSAYVHSGPIDPNGMVPDYRYVYAKQFLDRAKAINPKIQYYAWLGQKRSLVDLDNKKIRKNIVKISRLLVGDIGFDGIHYDFEPVSGHDTGFINLVKETDTGITPRPISIAIEEYIPSIMTKALSIIAETKDNVSKELLLEIAPHIDQLVVMTYDTKMDDPWKYSWLVKQEVIAITRLLPEMNIFIGVPTYDDQKPSFNPEAENISTGLNGVIAGLNSRRSIRDAIRGVAIYANWETDMEEWKVYRQLWQGIN